MGRYLAFRWRFISIYKNTIASKYSLGVNNCQFFLLFSFLKPSLRLYLWNHTKNLRNWAVFYRSVQEESSHSKWPQEHSEVVEKYKCVNNEWIIKTNFRWISEAPFWKQMIQKQILVKILWLQIERLIWKITSFP